MATLRAAAPISASLHSVPGSRPSSRTAAARSVGLVQSSVRASELPSQRAVLPLLSDYLAAQAATSRFEQLAGRAACLGVATAVAAELVLPSSGGLFGGAAIGTDAALLAPAAMFMLCCSVGLAARTHGRPLLRHRLLEPVLASLTSQRRSMAGVTGRNVDRAVDSAVADIFSDLFMCRHFNCFDDKFI